MGRPPTTISNSKMGTLWLCLSGVREQVKHNNLQIEHRRAARSRFVLLCAIAIWLILPSESILGQTDAQGVPGQSAGGQGPDSSRVSQDTQSSGAAESRPASASGPHTYGEAEKAGLNYAGTAPPRNALFLGFDAGSSYDDN